jgi:uncharacterized membrane protein YeaQ/YmgE (transglycosylase-associated protein family)
MQIALYLIVGLAIGLVSRSLVPGADLTGLLVSAAIGGLGALAGGLLGKVVWKPKKAVRFHLAGLALSVVGAAVLSFAWQRSPYSARLAPSPKRAEPTLAELRSNLLPSGAEPEAVIVLQKNEQGDMAPVLMGKLRAVPVDEGGEQVEKPDPLSPGNIIIVRDLDDQIVKDLKVTNGALQVAGAYISRENHELEYLGQVDLNKRNKRLAVEFGIQGESPTPKP